MEDEKELTHIDLFSGIGGFTLAGEWAGFRTIVFCEKEEFCQKILKKRFGAITYTDNRRQPRNLREKVSRGKRKTISNSKFSSRDSRGSGVFRPLLIPEIRDLDGTKWRGATLLTGGFPCQPFSVAGQRRGKEDDRYLWPEMLRVISEAKPRWILAENVPGIFHVALDTVLADLEGEGYETGTFIIPACSLNAPHRRNRIWIVGYSTDNGHSRRCEKTRRAKQQGEQRGLCEPEGANSHASDSKKQRLERRVGNKPRETWSRFRQNCRKNWQENWYEVATRFCRVDDGVSDRIHRLKALGNAIVPQIAYEILKNIAWIEKEDLIESHNKIMLTKGR